jgi:hypothetical protein
VPHFSPPFSAPIATVVQTTPLTCTLITLKTGDFLRLNDHANIMLDLECADADSPNPALVELRAVYFDMNTGAELDCIKLRIN